MEAEFEAIKKLLDDNNLTYKAYSHEHIHTSSDAAKVRGVPLHAGVKALIIKAETGLFLVLVPGDRKVDFAKLGLGKVRLADPDEVFRVTGCKVGSVHPFGNLFGLPVFMDKHILDNEQVNFSCGTHTDTIAMDPKDMVEIIKPKIGEYSKE